MLTKQTIFQPNPMGTGAGSWMSALAQKWYDENRKNSKDLYPWDFAVKIGFCDTTKDSDKIFSPLFDTEEQATNAIKQLGNNDINVDVIIDAAHDDVYAKFVGLVAKKVRAVKDHKNGYALYFKFIDNDGKAYFMKLTCRHDSYVLYDDDTEIEMIKSYVVNGAPTNGMPGYRYVFNTFSIPDGLILDKVSLSENKLDQSILKKENEHRLKKLNTIGNLPTSIEFKLPTYYSKIYETMNGKDHWVSCHGDLYMRTTKGAFRKYQHKYTETYEGKEFKPTDRDDDIVILHAKGSYQVWKKGAIPFLPDGHSHCFYDSKKIELLDGLNDFPDWTIEQQLGMDYIDKLILMKAHKDPYVEIHTDVCTDPDKINELVSKDYYGKCKYHE